MMQPPALQSHDEPSIEREQKGCETEISRLMALPLELQLLVTQQLPYPDSLAMKLTNTHFRDLIAPTHTVAKRVTWLLERASIALHIPTMGKLKLNTDELFVRSPEVQTILRERRTHQECVAMWKKEIRTDPKDRGNAFRGCLVRMDGNMCVGIEQIMAEVREAQKKRALRARRRWYQPSTIWFNLSHYAFQVLAIVIAILMALDHFTSFSVASLWFGSAIVNTSFVTCVILGVMLSKLMTPYLIPLERRLRSQWRAGNTWYLVELP